MATITLEHIHDDLIGLKKDMAFIKGILEEDLELSGEVLKGLESSRKRAQKEFISHEEMKREFA